MVENMFFYLFIDLQHELDEAVSKFRGLTMESQQFRDQLR